MFQIKNNKVFDITTVKTETLVSSKEIRESIADNEKVIAQLTEYVTIQKANLALVEKLEAELVK